ncbi:MAG: hypothetical protein O6941_04705 [Planctomycetota bacterium]|nr:hypothetical protein [Planctomycetota bacterium]MCZ6735789.1 hypothetical protein [Planctomycetota bacterium]
MADKADHGHPADPARESDVQSAALAAVRSPSIEVANPNMADAAGNVRMSRQTVKITQSDGSKIDATKTEIEISVRLAPERTVRALAYLITKPFESSGRVAIRIGKWLMATASTSSDRREKSA